jgi:hypothetical protein
MYNVDGIHLVVYVDTHISSWYMYKLGGYMKINISTYMVDGRYSIRQIYVDT